MGEKDDPADSQLPDRPVLANSHRGRKRGGLHRTPVEKRSFHQEVDAIRAEKIERDRRRFVVMMYRGWEVYNDGYAWIGTHPDYDGAPEHSFGPPADSRCFTSPTMKGVHDEIDEWLEEHPEDEPNLGE